MANDSVLEIVRSVAGRVGVTRPTTATGSTDTQVQQLVALLNEEGQELSVRHQWTVMNREKTFVTIAAEDQGLLVGGVILAAADGFQYIVNDTLWDRSTEYQLMPSTAARWQSDKSTLPVGPYSRYRLRGGRLLMLPAPTAGLTIAFEYHSENWVSNVTNDAFSTTFSADDDYPLIDSRLMTLGLKWRWKAAKGLEYAEDFNMYELAVLDAINRDTPAAPVSMNGPDRDNFEPYVVLPAGNWNQP